MKTTVLGAHISSTDYDSAANQIRLWVKKRNSCYICVSNVHMLMEAWDDPAFRRVINTADLVTPDGMPLVWMLRLKGYKNQQRVYGPTLMLHVLDMAAKENIPVGFYGGEPEVLKSLVKRMQADYPGLNVTYSYSPPFRVLTSKEDAEVVSKIQKSGAKILFVGLGCPKQEMWMADHRNKIPAVMLGVGAAFDIHAGAKKQAPVWLQRAGMEWLYRFVQEPGRLWRRYLFHNPRFIVLAIADLLGILNPSHR